MGRLRVVLLLLALLALLALPALPASADEIVLRSGGRLSGQIVEEREDAVVIQLPGGRMEIARDRIERIEREPREEYLAREALTSLQRGSFADAVVLLREACAIAPDDVGARHLLCTALLGLARERLAGYALEAAEKAALEVRATRPDHPDVAPLLRRIDAERAQAAIFERDGRAALEAGDWPRAIATLEAWRLRTTREQETPDLLLAQAWAGRAVSMERGRDLAAALDAWRTSRAYARSAAADEALQRLAPVAVIEELREGDLAEARRLLERIDPGHAHPGVARFLGALVHHLAGEADRAVEEYAEAARLAEGAQAPPDALEYELVRDQATAALGGSLAQPASQGARRWVELFLDPLQSFDSGHHFTVYAATGPRAEEIAAAAERGYEDLARRLLGRVPATAGGDRVQLVVHPSRQAYVAADPVPRGSPLANLTLPRDKTGGVTASAVDAEGRPIIRVEIHEGDPGLLADTLPHELVHVVQRRGLAAYRVAHWLDEALAMMAESDRGRAERVRRARRDEAPLPLTRLFTLRSTPRDAPGRFYDQAYAVTAYLHERKGDAAWNAFLGRLVRGTIDDALRAAYDLEGVDDLERAWLAWLRDT